MSKIQEYFNGRLKFTQKNGVVISGDFLGNTVITSVERSEQTFAGKTPASLVASPEGIHILAANPGVLTQIYDGTILHQKHIWGGLESKIYKIVLQTPVEPKEFALKYTFPINEMGGLFTSGIIAMRMMQLAQKERPIPHIHYTVPIFATHDITVAPFTFDGITTDKLIYSLNNPNKANVSYLLKDVLLEKHKQLISEMIDRETIRRHADQPTFIHSMNSIIHTYDQVLVGWVKKQCRQYPVFSQHKYKINDTCLAQSVVNIEPLYALSNQFYENPMLYSFDPKFTQDFLHTLSLVELGVGMRRVMRTYSSPFTH